MNALAQQVRLFLLAVQFFTRLPVTGRLANWVGFNPQLLRESAAYFPMVGVVVGIIAAGVFLATSALYGRQPMALLLASALSLVATLLLTGAFHEDGLADVADGLGGHVDAAKAMEIMKDSRVGAYGAIAVCVAMVVKVVAVAHLASWGVAHAAVILVLAHVLSRNAALWLIACLDHVGSGDASKSKPLADKIAPKALWIANLTTFCALVTVFIHLNATVLIVIAATSGLVAWRMAAWFKRRIGGFTGDCLGATQQVCEICIYLAASATLAVSASLAALAR